MVLTVVCGTTVMLLAYFLISRLAGISASVLLLGRQQGHLASKKSVVDLLVVTIWSFARVVAPVVTTTYVILSSRFTWKNGR